MIVASQRDYGRIVAVRLEDDFYLMRLTSKMQTEHYLNPKGQEKSILQVATQAKGGGVGWGENSASEIRPFSKHARHAGRETAMET